MLVGLNRFSIIWISVARSTPGNRVSTELTMLDALSPASGMGGSDGKYVPSALGSLAVACPDSISPLSCAS